MGWWPRQERLRKLLAGKIKLAATRHLLAKIPAAMNGAGPNPAAWRAIATMYNALVTAMVVSLVARRGSEMAREYVFRHFRRQHLAKFLGGLHKLGLAGQPHAVACALYHFHSNALGGVKTEFVRESDRKAWVRYPPPRWMWRGTAIAAIPHEVSAAMLHGWHGHNGVSLGNSRLGFVCTGMTVDGMPGLEGYYLEHDRALEPGERVRFAYGEETMPRYESSAAPRLESASWPQERVERTRRRYAMDYVRTMLLVMEGLLGAAAARTELGRVARLVGLQFHEEAAHEMGLASNVGSGTRASAASFATWLQAMLEGQGEEVALEQAEGAVVLSLQRWRLAEDLGLRDLPGAFAAWNGLWGGACAAHDRFLRLDTGHSVANGVLSVRWKVETLSL